MRTLAIRLSTLGVALGLSACYTGIDADSFDELGDESDTGDDEAGSFTGGGEEGSGGSSAGSSGGDSSGGDSGNDTSGDSSGSDTSGGDSGDGDGDTSDGDTSESSGGSDTSGDSDTSEDSESSGSSDTSGGDTSDSGGMGGDMPDNAYCSPVDAWDPEWVAWELEVVELVNQARAQGGNCGSEGNFPPSGPLTWEAALTCAARVHSKDMADNNFFSHTNQQGQDPWWRIGQAEYGGGGPMGENIAAGYGSPAQTVQGWLDSDGHCANMLNPGFSEIGVGYAYGPNSSYGHYWTQTFGGG